MIKSQMLSCLLKSAYSVHTLVTYHTVKRADLIQQTFISPTGPDCKVYYKCVSPSTEKYPQPETFSDYTLSISLSWKLQKLGPNTTLLRLQWMNLKHTQVFLSHFLFERKNSFHRKRNRMKDPYWQLLPIDSTLRFNLCCRLRHWHFLSLCNAPEQEIRSTVIPNNGRITSKYILVPIISFHKNPKVS